MEGRKKWMDCCGKRDGVEVLHALGCCKCAAEAGRQRHAHESRVLPSPPHFGKVCRLDDERDSEREEEGERAPPRKAIFGSENRDFGTLLFLTCDTLAIKYPRMGRGASEELELCSEISIEIVRYLQAPPAGRRKRPTADGTRGAQVCCGCAWCLTRPRQCPAALPANPSAAAISIKGVSFFMLPSNSSPRPTALKIFSACPIWPINGLSKFSAHQSPRMNVERRAFLAWARRRLLQPQRRRRRKLTQYQ